MINVYLDKPLSRSEYWLFQLIKRLDKKTYVVYGNTVMSTVTPTPDNPATFQNVIYDKTRTGYETELRSIGIHKDKISINMKTKSATIERHIGVLELDGSEDWSEYNPEVAPQQGLSFQFIIGDALNGANSSICTHFRYLFNAWDVGGANLTGIYTDHQWYGNRYFRKPYAEIDTLEKFTAWLAEMKTNGTPVTLYYILAVPTSEDIPFID